MQLLAANFRRNYVSVARIATISLHCILLPKATGILKIKMYAK